MSVAVTFLKPYSLYNAGETAGFGEEQAEALIAAGVAVEADDANKAEKAAAKALAKQQAAEAKAQAEAAAKAEAEKAAAEAGKA
ncbi:hypothetical protein ACLBKU_12000 [Erythrobacter sp. NE805]|uniref:hypothetical protein n=1 Tax=Erythrobacter sp. NE805 TaxID=3389875 RepID=UPI00396AFE1B